MNATVLAKMKPCSANTARDGSTRDAKSASSSAGQGKEPKHDRERRDERLEVVALRRVAEFVAGQGVSQMRLARSSAQSATEPCRLPRRLSQLTRSHDTLRLVTDPALDQGIIRPYDGPHGEGPSDHKAAHLSAFACPRCGEEVTEAFYGPCSACREALVQKFAGEGPSVARAASGRPMADGPDSGTWIDRL